MSQQNLYLPISEKTVIALLESSDAPSHIHGLADHELAAVMVLQRLPEFMEGTTANLVATERLLAKLIQHGADARREGVEDALAHAATRYFDVSALSHAHQAIQTLSPPVLQFLDDAVLRAQNFLDNQGLWDFTFSERHQALLNPFSQALDTPSGDLRTVTDPQYRIMSLFLSEMNESLNIQGYAGSGKTYLIHSIVEHLNPRSTLLLAMTGAQLQGLKEKLKNPQIASRTFADLAKWVLSQDQTAANRRWLKRADRRFQVHDSEVAKRMGFQDVGGMSPTQTAKLARRVVMSFCYSANERIELEHLKKAGANLGWQDQQTLLQYARRLWRELIAPSESGIELPLRGYHLIKYLSMSPHVIPSSVTHVIVDESHELSAPVMALLNRSPQAVITLGDEYQRLSGRAPQPEAWIRQREVFSSIRTGREIESIINPVIQAHPGKTKVPFEGARDHPTRIQYYDKPFVPERPTTILVANEWHLFEWFQRLSSAGAPFRLLSGAQRDFRQFVQDCIGLYHERIRPTHPFLFQHDSWDKLAQAQSNTSAFKRIEAMLARGYHYADFERALSQSVNQREAEHWLGRVQDAKNREFDRVMVTPELVRSWRGNDKETAASVLSQLYTAATRERFEVLVPGYLRDWLKDQP